MLKWRKEWLLISEHVQLCYYHGWVRGVSTPGLGVWGTCASLMPFTASLLPPCEPATRAMLPFSWGLKGLALWASLDMHRPIPPAARGVVAPHPHPRPDSSRLGSASQGPDHSER